MNKIFIALLLCCGFAAQAQDITPTANPVTAMQWHLSVRSPQSDWIYSMVATDKKEYIACGYSRYHEDVTNIHYSPAIFKIDHLGNLAWMKTLPSNQGTLWQITKGSDGYVAIGWWDAYPWRRILLVEVDDNGNYLNGTPVVLTPTTSLNGTSPGYEKGVAGFSVALDPNTNSIKHLVIGSAYSDSLAGVIHNYACISLVDFNSSSWQMTRSYYPGNDYGPTGGGLGGNRILKIVTKSTSSNEYDIYTNGFISEPGDNIKYTDNNADGEPVTITTFNKDIWVMSLHNTPTLTSLNYSKNYNKGNITTSNASGTNISLGNITAYQYTETGPLTARNEDPSHGGAIKYTPPENPSVPLYSPVTKYFNFSNNANEQGEDMLFTADGNLALTALVNIIGANNGNDGSSGGHLVQSSLIPGPDKGPLVVGQFDEFQDGDGFLLKIKPSDGSLIYAKNVGHFSGDNFNVQLIQDQAGRYIVGGSTGDKFNVPGDYNLQDAVDNEQNGYVVCTDDSHTTDIWRRSFAANDTRAGADDYEDCFCLFGLVSCADGGYVVAGNNDNNLEDYSITKFAPLNEELLIANGGYTNFVGGTAPVPETYTLTGDEHWPNANVPDKSNIASKIIVPYGKTLTIQEDPISGQPSTFNFAASDQLYDYYKFPSQWTGELNGTGIYVEPGGSLVLKNTTLQSINTGGELNMWDGVVVHGKPTAAQSGFVQGEVQMNNATIKNARYGIYISENYRTYSQSPNAAFPATSTSFVANMYSSRYNGYADQGGGIVYALNSNFLDCRFGVNFQNYHINSNSAFTGCHFVTDASGMNDICFYTDANGGTLPSNCHLAGWAVQGITLKGNTFTCDASFAPRVRPTGITAADAGMKITDANIFTNLTTGITGSYTPGNNSYWLQIENNSFDNSGTDIRISSSYNALDIKNNYFGVPGPGANTGYIAPTGIVLAGCHGYSVSQNTFSICASCNNFFTWLENRGIVANHGPSLNGGADLNDVIDLNKFGGMWYPSIAAQINGDNNGNGLQWHCNSYNTFFDIMRLSSLQGLTSATLVPAMMRKQQGTCPTGSSPNYGLPAGNQFNVGCFPGIYHLYGDGAVTQFVQYNNNQAGSVFDPGACNTPVVYFNNSCPTVGVIDVSQACPVPKADNGGVVVLNGSLKALDATIAGTDPKDEDTYNELQMEHAQLVAELARTYTQTGDYADAGAMLETYGLYGEAFPFYIQAGDYTDAGRVQGLLPTTTDDETLYAYLTRKALSLYSSGNNWLGVDSTTLDSIKHVTKPNSVPGYMAGAIDTLLGVGPIVWPVPDLDSVINPDSLAADTTLIDSTIYARKIQSTSPPISTVSNLSAETFSVAPNPTYGLLTVNASVEGGFVVYTMEGKKLASYNLKQGETELKLPAGMAPGVYMGIYQPALGGKQKVIRLVYEQ